MCKPPASKQRRQTPGFRHIRGLAARFLRKPGRRRDPACRTGAGAATRAAAAACLVALACPGPPQTAAAGVPGDGAAATDPGRAARFCRAPYDGRQPAIAVPPAYVVDAPLPSFYCEDAGQWVFVYATAGTVQLYRLDPGRKESYAALFTAASRSEVAPWAMRSSRLQDAGYLVNRNPAVDAEFDYRVPSEAFDACAELAALPQVTTAQAGDCPEPDGGSYAHSESAQH